MISLIFLVAAIVFMWIKSRYDKIGAFDPLYVSLALFFMSMLPWGK